MDIFPGALTALPPTGRWRWLALFSYLWEPFAWMLEAAAVLFILLQQWNNLILTLAALILNTAAMHQRARHASSSQGQPALALRAGSWCVVPAAQLMPGDAIWLSAEGEAAADMVLVSGHSLQISSSQHLRACHVGDILFAGSCVLGGMMRGIVVTAGAHAGVARLSRRKQSPPALPLQKELRRGAVYLSLAWVVLIGALLTMDIFPQVPVRAALHKAIILAAAATGPLLVARALRCLIRPA
ncbi:MAG: hypothetical protein JO089_08955 [Alphaproteobacteria bacterium]|nr:hypothetical protein [Alphaproteobacteria bacterium]